MNQLPRYPIYVPSKGRSQTCLTARFFTNDEVPFYLVVEPQEADEYAPLVPAENLLILPFSNLGLGSIPARNWIWEHAKSAGHDRHWIIDDNIAKIKRRHQGRRIPCNAGIGLAVVEDFTDRYTNVGISGLAYEMFLPNGRATPAFSLNVHVYSCLLIANDLPYRWRGRYNEDTDLCLQVLAGGYCTVLVQAILIWKAQSMLMTGGNTDELYQGDGRLKMARSLEKSWPGVVETRRRYGRPQHVINWRKFDTPLIRRPDLEIPEGVDEYGMELVAVKEVKSPRLQRLLKESQKPTRQ